MDAIKIIAAIGKAIQTAVELGPDLLKTEQDIEPFARAVFDTLSGKEITQADLDALEAKIAALSAELQEPLPPEDAK